MPPLYGEGENAFMRLQLEIINKTDDDCIFAWDAVGHHGLLAPSPSLFIGSSSVVRNIWDPLRPPHSMSSKGLCAHFPLIPNDESYVFNSHSSMDKNLEFVAPLNCKLSRLHGDINYKKVLALPIYHSISTEGTSKWNRNAKLQEFDVDSLGHRNLEGVNRKMIYVPHTPWGFSEDSIEEKTNFTRMQVKIDSLLVLGFTIKQCLMRELNAFWDCSDDPTLYPCENSFMESRSRASVTIENDNFQRVAIALGLSNGFLWVDIVILDMDEAMEQILDSVLLARKSLIGRDRISRPFLHGSLNARINKDSFADTVSRVVEVTFDPQGKLRWPVGKT